jgi:hypothetical protein
VPGVRGLTQGGLVLLDRARELAEPRRDVVHRLLALGRHQVEDLPQAVQRADDHVDLAGDLARLVAFEFQAQPFEHGLLGDQLQLGRRLGRPEVGERAPGQRRVRGQTVR